MSSLDCKSCFVLSDNKEKRIWGVFTNKEVLFSMYHNLKSLNTSLELTVKEYALNSNIVVSQTTVHSEIVRKFNPYVNSTNESNQTVVPSELKNEFTRLQLRLSEFKNNLIVFKQLMADGLLTVESPLKDVPFLLRDKFHILADIVKLDIQEEEAFGYFMDRYYYKTILPVEVSSDDNV